MILSATADRHIKDQFLAHLAPLVREHRLQLWHRGMARPGQSVRSNAEAWLKLANHVLVLLSPDYLRSPLCTLLEKTAIDEGKIVHVAYIRPVAIVPPEAAKRLSSGTSALSERANQDQAYAERLSALVDSFDYWRTAGTRDSSEVS